jgi:hypothetical protein
MQGDKIGEENGKVTTRRVLPGDDYRYVKLEISFESQCTLYGIQGQNMGTYTAWERVPGQIYAEGQGIFLTQTGEGAIWNGHGIGQGREDGSLTFAASVAFQAPTSGGLSKLNGVLALVEHQTAADGTAHSDLFEWKPK